jgi:hypothetical protein
LKRTSIGLPIILVVIVSLACAGSSATKTPEPVTSTPPPTVDTQATVDAAISDTSTMQSSYQAAVSTSVAATVTAMPPIPTPLPAEAVNSLTEEELAAMTVASVNQATTATSQAYASAEQAAADGVITADELVSMYSYWIYTDELITYAIDLATAYSDAYGELATETLALLESLESDLNTAAQQIETILPVLDQLTAALDQGSIQSSQALGQLDTAVRTAQANILVAQGQAQSWNETLKTETQQRIDQALAVQPQQIADSRKAAIQSALDYVASVRTALEDMRITQAELADIAQVGANAVASLTAQGGPQLAKLVGSINDITTLIAAGQLSSALASLEAFQAALPAMP